MLKNVKNHKKTSGVPFYVILKKKKNEASSIIHACIAFIW